MIISKKAKKEIERLEEENRNLKIAIENVRVRCSELKDEIEDWEKNASEETVAQHMRNAIVRKCERIGINTVYCAEASAFDVWALIAAYNSFVYLVERT